MLITAEQAAEMLGTSASHVRALRRSGVLPAVDVGRKVRFALADLKAFIAEGGRKAPPSERATQAPTLARIGQNGAAPQRSRGRPRLHSGGLQRP